MGKVTLTISILASRNREQVVRCLDSLRPLQDAISTELILTDTSGDEEMNALLYKYTDHVLKFDWCNDFSKARNLGLSQARGEWFFFMDDDEWLGDATELIQFFQSGDYQNYGCANYIQRNYHDPELKIYTDSWVSRMIRIGKDTHFESRIHEYLTPQEGEGKNLHFFVNHTGYIYQTAEDKRKHFERNEPLLRQMVEDEPKEIRWRVHLLQEYYFISDWKRLEEFASNCLMLFTEKGDASYCRDIGTFFAAAAEGLLRQKKHRECLEQLQTALQDGRCQETCLAYLWLLLMQCFYEMGSYDKVSSCRIEYFDILRQLQGKQIRMENQQGALITGQTFSDIHQKKVYALEMMADFRMGKTDSMVKYFSKLEWDKPVIYCPDGFVEALAYGMAMADRWQDFVEPMQISWNHPELHADLFRECQLWRERNQEGYIHILHILSRIQAKHWFVYYATILYGEKEACDSKALEGAFRKFLKYTPNILLTPEEIKGVLGQYHIDYERCMLELPMDRWDLDVQDYLKNAPLQDMLILERELLKSSYVNEMAYAYVLMRLSEARFHKLDSLQSFQDKKAAAESYAKRASSFYRTFYPDMAFQHPEQMPDFIQAAFFMENALAQEEKDQEKAQELWNYAMQVCPGWTPSIERYLKARNLYDQTREFDEILALRRQVKKALKEARKFLDQKEFEKGLACLETLPDNELYELDRCQLHLELVMGALENGVKIDVKAPEASNEHPVLTIGLLASNRKEAVMKCVNSLELLREKVPCQLVVLDTGCEESLRAFLQEKADLLADFTWINDFAAARNETLKYAKGDWYFYLDDDEWLEDASPLVRFLRENTSKEIWGANCISRNYQDWNFEHFSDSRVSRLIRLTADTHFESRIHEYFGPILGDMEELPLVIHHSGYIYANNTERELHCLRNVLLLEEMLAEEPENPRWRTHLIQEHVACEHWREAAQLSIDGLEWLQEQEEPQESHVKETFYLGWVLGLQGLHSYEDMLDVIKLAQKDKAVYPLLSDYLELYKALAYYHIDEQKLTEECLLTYFRRKEYYEANPDAFYAESGSILLDEAFSEASYKLACALACACELWQDRMEEFQDDFALLEWDKPCFFQSEEMACALTIALARTNDASVLNAFSLGFCNDEMRYLLLENLWALQEEYQETALLHLKGLEGNHWLLLLANASIPWKKQCEILKLGRAAEEINHWVLQEKLEDKRSVGKVLEELSRANLTLIEALGIQQVQPEQREWQASLKLGQLLLAQSVEEKLSLLKEAVIIWPRLGWLGKIYLDQLRKSLKGPVVLSIALMVSNRKDTIAKCIESLKPIQEAIPTELILLDTGCDVDLRMYLESKGDVVADFKWCRDFAKARNVTLDYAAGEWFMYLDDDEWFTDTEELITFFTSGEYKNYGYASYIQRNYLDMQGNQWSDSWVSRMVKRTPGIRFVSKIHEYIDGAAGNCKGLRSVVDHYGYVFETEEALKKHTERNVSLLLEMLEEEPDQLRWWVQLAQEYRKVSDGTKLLDCCDEALARFVDWDASDDRKHICAFYAGKMLAYKEMEIYSAEIKAGVDALSDNRCTELMKAFVSLHLAEACYFQGREIEAGITDEADEEWQHVSDLFSEAALQVEEYLKWKEFFAENEPIQYLQSGTAFVGECFDDVMIKEAYSIAIACSLLKRDTSALKKYFDKLEWTNEYLYVFEDIVGPLIEAMCVLPREPIFDKVLCTMQKHKGLWAYVTEQLLDYEKQGFDVTPILTMVQELLPEALGKEN